MKKLLAIAAPMAAMVFLAQPALAGKPFAPTTMKSSQGAVVFKNTFCVVPEVGTVTTRSHAVITPSGNVTLACHAQTAQRGRTMSEHLDEICHTPGGVATSGHIVITKKGRVNAVCHVHAAQPTKASLNPTTTNHGQGSGHRWQHGAVAGVGPSAVGKKLGHLTK